MRVAVFAVALVGLYIAPAASASTIILSEYSADSTPASVLDATLDFTITDIAELTFSVTNDTTAPDEYDMNMLFFNATSNVTGLTLQVVRSSGGEDPPPEEWVLEVAAGSSGPTKANGFGIFDYALIDGVGPDPHQIAPGETLEFVMDITGTGPFYDWNFSSELSAPYAGDIQVVAAAKFVDGPSGDSGYGGTIPEPGTFSLLVLAGLGLTVRRRRR